MDCTGEITVIHNGIIENFRELRDGLEARGHTLDVGDRHGGDRPPRRGGLRGRPRRRGAGRAAPARGRLRARRHAPRRDRAGSSAPARTCRSSSGLHGEESFLASDVAAILAHTNRVIFLEEGDVADVRPTGVVVTDVDGNVRERPRDDHRLDARGRREGRLRALHAQGDPRAAGGAPPVDRRPGRRATAGSRSTELEPIADAIRAATRVELVACGTAYYASLVGAAALQDWTGLPARATVGSEFRYSPPPLDARDARHRGHPVRRDGRHDRPDPARPGARLPDHRRHEHRRLGDHARGGRGRSSSRPARRSRSRPPRRS